MKKFETGFVKVDRVSGYLKLNLPNASLVRYDSSAVTIIMKGKSCIWC